MLKIKPYEAAVFLNDNLCLGVEIGKNKYNIYNENEFNNQSITTKKLLEWEQKTFCALTNKYHRLKRYEKIMNKLFKNYPDLYFNDANVVYYLQNKEKMEYFIERFIDINTTDNDEIYSLKKQLGEGW